MSNRERIARAAEEARLAEEEKASKRAAPKPRKSSARASKPVRMKIVWEVRDSSGKAIKTFAYPDKAAGESEARALTSRTGSAHTLAAAKVPMD